MVDNRDNYGGGEINPHANSHEHLYKSKSNLFLHHQINLCLCKVLKVF